MATDDLTRAVDDMRDAAGKAEEALRVAARGLESAGRSGKFTDGSGDKLHRLDQAYDGLHIFCRMARQSVARHAEARPPKPGKLPVGDQIAADAYTGDRFR